MHAPTLACAGLVVGHAANHGHVHATMLVVPSAVGPCWRCRSPRRAAPRNLRTRRWARSGGLPSESSRAFEPSNQFKTLGKPDPGDWLAEHPERGQTVEQFLHGKRVAVGSERRTLFVQPVGDFPANESPSLDSLQDYAQRFLGLPVKLLPPLGDGALATVARRRNERILQLHAPDILEILEQRLPATAYGLVAVTMTDLYPEPSWNFVFGLATLRKRVGVYSFARFDPAFYGRPRTPSGQHKMLERAAKIMTHELGHMFGMKHCIHFRCLMNGSNSLPETDASPMHLCPVCLRKLHLAVGFSPAARYAALRDYYRDNGFVEQARWTERRLAHLAGRSN